MKRTVDSSDEQPELLLGVPRRDDTAMVAGIRKGEDGALREFCERFRPLLLDQARRLGVSHDDREWMVIEFLDDMALRISVGDVPYLTASFIVRGFRNAVVDRWRKTQRARDTEVDERVPSVISEFSRQASRDPWSTELNTKPSAVDVLAAYLLAQCTAAERNLVVWSSNGVPLRLIAEWLGVSYSAAKVRWHRLRAKLHDIALAYLDIADVSDRIELERFLRYARVLSHETISKHREVEERHVG